LAFYLADEGLLSNVLDAEVEEWTAKAVVKERK